MRTNLPLRRQEHVKCAQVEDLLAGQLEMAGVPVLRLLDVEYKNLTNREAMQEKLSTFNGCSDLVACLELHLNRGGGSYSAVVHHNTSGMGRLLAQCIGGQLRVAFPFASRGAISEDELDRGPMFFVRRTKAPAVIVEPGFTDDPGHPGYWDQPGALDRYAAATFLGVMSFLENL